MNQPVPASDVSTVKVTGPQHITVQMTAVFELYVGARMQFAPNVYMEAEDNGNFRAFAEKYGDQECVVARLFQPPPLPLSASEEEPDDAEAAFIAQMIKGERLYPTIVVRFSDGTEHQLKVFHLLALDVQQQSSAEGERDPAGLRAYSAATEEQAMQALYDARKLTGESI